jgi:hypothetical protein
MAASEPSIEAESQSDTAVSGESVAIGVGQTARFYR